MNILKYVKSPSEFIIALAEHGLLPFFTDEKFIKYKFKVRMGYELDLKNPISFNEKLQWLKLHDRRCEYTAMVDKYEVKRYVASIIGEEHIIPTLGVWDKFEEIDFSKLPNKFVLKCTHDSGGVVVCQNKEELDIRSVQKQMNKMLKKNYYWHSREWPYKNVKPRIIAEKYMTDESGTELKDYKIFNFNGVPKLIQVDYNRFTNHKRNLYSTEWEYIDGMIQYPNDPDVVIERPKKLEEMLQFAELLSKGIPHVRTDFYSINGEIYFGELTFFHGSGHERFEPKSLEIQMGEWLKLPELDKT